MTVYSEAILKLSHDSHVTVMLPSTSETLLSIQYLDIRRLGYTDSYNRDIVWFETCKNSQADMFFFIVVPSGMEVAKQIIQELKTVIQAHTSSILILEDSTGVDVSYISREHYGCAEYSAESRAHILHSGIYHLPPPISSSSASPRFFGGREAPPLTPLTGQQDLNASSNSGGAAGGIGGVSLEEFGRRKSKSVKCPPPRRPTLDKFVRQSSLSSFDRQPSSRNTSVSSFDRSFRTASLEHDVPTPTFHELSDGHYSSGSASDVFDSPSTTTTTASATGTSVAAHGHIQRKLSLQSSISSQGSSNGSTHSPAILEEDGLELAEGFSFEGASSAHQLQHQQSFSYSGMSGPIVPPRSMVSLQPDAYLPGKMTAAH